MDSFVNAMCRRSRAFVRVDMADIVEAETSAEGGSVIRTSNGQEFDYPNPVHHFLEALCKAHVPTSNA